MTTRTVTVELPAKHVMNANRRTDAHPRVRPIKTRAVRDAFTDAAHGLAPLTTPVEVTVRLAFARKHSRRDSPNWYPTVKAAIDGLVSAGVIADDSDAHIHWTHFAAHTVDHQLAARPKDGLDTRVRLTITLTTTTQET